MKRARSGLRVEGSGRDGRRQRVGLQGGDLIVKMAGVRIKNLHDLVYVLRSKRAGDTIEVVFIRKGQAMRGTTTLERRR